MEKKTFDVIIIGGSYAGLAAGMALGRALKKVLIIDDGRPCNQQTPHSHNFLTNDGISPREIGEKARKQIEKYETIKFVAATATEVHKTGNKYTVQTENGNLYLTKALIFASGINDHLPAIDGLKECWGISVLHCPYCHGYEIRNLKTGVLGNGQSGFEFARLISNWTNDLLLFTNGVSTLSESQINSLTKHGIKVNQKEIIRVEHQNGYIQNLRFSDGTKEDLKALYAPSPFEQKSKLPQKMGCEISEEGYIKVDGTFETTVKNIYAIGDAVSKMRTVANAVAAGTTLGMLLGKKLINEEF